MRKISLTILAIILMLACAGCQQTKTDHPEYSEENQETTMKKTQAQVTQPEWESSETTQEMPTEDTETAQTTTVETETSALPSETIRQTEPPMPDPPEPPDSIEVRSMQDFAVMKEMIACEDEALVDQYLSGLYGGGAQSKDDLIAFVSLVEKTPYIAFLDGEIVWISLTKGKSVDTNTSYEVLYISTQASNGDWVRLEYLLSEKDVAGKIAKESAEEKDTSLITTPIRNQDGKITLHIETREKHPSDPGDVISWVANVDGIFTRVIYYTTNASKVDTASLLGELQITGISANDAKQ